MNNETCPAVARHPEHHFALIICWLFPGKFDLESHRARSNGEEQIRCSYVSRGCPVHSGSDDDRVVSLKEPHDLLLQLLFAFDLLFGRRRFFRLEKDLPERALGEYVRVFALKTFTGVWKVDAAKIIRPRVFTKIFCRKTPPFFYKL
jgi:hypothetical protein